MGTWQHPSAGPWGGTGTNPGRETTQICAHSKRAHVCARTRTCLNAHIQRVCAHRRAHVRTRACPTMHTYGAHKHTYAHLAQPHAHRMCPHLQIPTHSTHTRAHTRAHQHTGAHLSANADACTQHTRAHGGTLLSPAPPQPWGKPSPSDTRLNTHVPAAGQPPAICLCVRVSVVARGERRRWRGGEGESHLAARGKHRPRSHVSRCSRLARTPAGTAGTAPPGLCQLPPRLDRGMGGGDRAAAGPSGMRVPVPVGLSPPATLSPRRGLAVTATQHPTGPYWYLLGTHHCLPGTQQVSITATSTQQVPIGTRWSPLLPNNTHWVSIRTYWSPSLPTWHPTGPHHHHQHPLGLHQYPLVPITAHLARAESPPPRCTVPKAGGICPRCQQFPVMLPAQPAARGAPRGDPETWLWGGGQHTVTVPWDGDTWPWGRGQPPPAQLPQPAPRCVIPVTVTPCPHGGDVTPVTALSENLGGSNTMVASRRLLRQPCASLGLMRSGSGARDLPGETPQTCARLCKAVRGHTCSCKAVRGHTRSSNTVRGCARPRRWHVAVHVPASQPPATLSPPARSLGETEAQHEQGLRRRGMGVTGMVPTGATGSPPRWLLGDEPQTPQVTSREETPCPLSPSVGDSHPQLQIPQEGRDQQ